MRTLFSGFRRQSKWLVTTALFICSPAYAEFTLTNLDANTTAAKAKHRDANLVNGWGLAYSPGGPFWVNAAGTGKSLLYDSTGKSEGAPVLVPPAAGGTTGTPTGIVYNSSNEFQIESWTSVFLFATLDGTISGWSTFAPNAALLAVDNSASHASYNGLAITHKSSGNFLYAADTANNKIDMYDGTFQLVKSFTDSTVPAGFVVSGIQDINGKLFVAYVEATGKSGGYIDIFKEDGTFVKRFAQGKPLNQPWGIALAPSNFGSLSNTILITNNIDKSGTINGFNTRTGKLVGTVKDSKGAAIKIDQLWGIEFGGGSAVNGKKNQLFWTAGPRADTNGVFGVLSLTPKTGKSSGSTSSGSGGGVIYPR